MKAASIWAALSFIAAAGCGGDAKTSSGQATGEDGGTGSGGAAACGAGMDKSEGGCIDPLRRYEPAERLDVDNVVSYGGPALTMELPDPPKSGFRLVVPPRELVPGDEVEECHAWAFPALHHRNVYAARVYTSGGLHHSNMYGVPLDPSGPSPYPACGPDQSSIFKQIPNLLTGNIMDVLFANSTQIEGGEQIVFHPGMAFKLTTDQREVATSIHWLSTADEPLTSEIVYDFFTMPDELVTTEIVPFVFDNQGFEIAPNSRGDITTTCGIVGTGNLVTIMPHTHKRATAFNVDLIDASGTAKTIFHDGNFDTGSEITVFDEPISLEGFTQIRHRCDVNNDLATPIVYGIGDNEMCTLFGYMYPPQAQQLGYLGKGATDCLAIPIGSYRK